MISPFQAGDQVSAPTLGVGTVVRVTFLAGGVAVVVNFPRMRRAFEYITGTSQNPSQLTRVPATVPTTHENPTPVGQPVPPERPAVLTPTAPPGITPTAPSGPTWRGAITQVKSLSSLPYVDVDLCESVSRRLEQKLLVSGLENKLSSMSPDDVFRFLVESMDSYEDIDLMIRALPATKRLAGMQSVANFGQSRVNQAMVDAYRRRLRASGEKMYLPDQAQRGRLFHDVGRPAVHSPDIAATAATRQGKGQRGAFNSLPEQQRIAQQQVAAPKAMRVTRQQESWQALIESLSGAGGSGAGQKQLQTVSQMLSRMVGSLPELNTLNSADDVYRILAPLFGDPGMAGTAKADALLIRINKHLPPRLQLSKSQLKAAVRPFGKWQVDPAIPVTEGYGMGYFDRMRAEALPDTLNGIPQLAEARARWRTYLEPREAIIREWQPFLDIATNALKQKPVMAAHGERYFFQQLHYAVHGELRDEEAKLITDPTEEIMKVPALGRTSGDSWYPWYHHLDDIRITLGNLGLPPVQQTEAMTEELMHGMGGEIVPGIIEANDRQIADIRRALSVLDPADPATPIVRTRLTLQLHVLEQANAAAGYWRRTLHDPLVASHLHTGLEDTGDYVIERKTKDEEARLLERREYYNQTAWTPPEVQGLLADETPYGYTMRAILGMSREADAVQYVLQMADGTLSQKQAARELDKLWVLSRDQKESRAFLATRAAKLKTLGTTASPEEYRALARKWIGGAIGVDPTAPMSVFTEAVASIRTAFTAGLHASGTVAAIPKIGRVLDITEIRPSDDLLAGVRAARGEELTGAISGLQAQLSAFEKARTKYLANFSYNRGSHTVGITELQDAEAQMSSTFEGLRPFLDPFTGSQGEQYGHARAFYNRTLDYLQQLREYRAMTGFSYSDFEENERALAPEIRLATVATDLRDALSVGTEDFVQYYKAASRDWGEEGHADQLAALRDVYKTEGGPVSLAQLQQAHLLRGKILLPGIGPDGLPLPDVAWRTGKAVPIVSTLYPDAAGDIVGEAQLTYSSNLHRVLGTVGPRSGRYYLGDTETLATPESIVRSALDATMSQRSRIEAGLHIPSTTGHPALSEVARMDAYDEAFAAVHFSEDTTSGVLDRLRPLQARTLAGYLMGEEKAYTQEELNEFAGKYGVETVTSGELTHYNGIWDAVQRARAAQGREMLSTFRMLPWHTMKAHDLRTMHPLYETVFNEPGTLERANEMLGIDPSGQRITELSLETSTEEMLRRVMPTTPVEYLAHLDRPHIAVTPQNEALLQEMGQLHMFEGGNGFEGMVGGEWRPLTGYHMMDGHPVFSALDSSTGETLAATPGGKIATTAKEADTLAFNRATQDAMQEVAREQSRVSGGAPRLRSGQFVIQDANGNILGNADTARARTLAPGQKIFGLDIETHGPAYTPYLISTATGVIQPDGSIAVSDDAVHVVGISAADAQAMKTTLAEGTLAGDSKHTLLTKGLQEARKKLGLSDTTPLEQVIDALSDPNMPQANDIIKSLQSDVAAADVVMGYNLHQFDYPVLSGHAADTAAMQQKTVDLFAIAYHQTGAEPSLQSLLPYAETHAGDDVRDAMTYGWDYARKLLGTDHEAPTDVPYFVSRSTGAIYQHAETTATTYAGGSHSYTSTFQQVLTPEEEALGAVQRTMTVGAYSPARLAGSIGNKLAAASTIEEAQQLHQAVLEDRAMRRVRRFEPRYLAQDQQVIAKALSLQVEPGGMAEGLRQWAYDLAQVPSWVQQAELHAQRVGVLAGEIQRAEDAINSQADGAVKRHASLIAEMNDRMAQYESLTQRIQAAGITDDIEKLTPAHIIRRAERLHEASGRIIQGLESGDMDANVLAEQYQVLSKGVFGGSNPAGNALMELASTVDELVGSKAIAAAKGQLMLSHVWHQLYSHGLVQEVSLTEAERNAMQMRTTVNLGEISAPIEQSTMASVPLVYGTKVVDGKAIPTLEESYMPKTKASVSFNTTSQETMKASWETAIKNAHDRLGDTGTSGRGYAHREDVATSMEAALRKRLGLEDETLAGDDLLKAAHQRLLEEPLKYYDMMTLAPSGREEETLQAITYWTDAMRKNPHAAISSITNPDTGGSYSSHGYYEENTQIAAIANLPIVNPQPLTLPKLVQRPMPFPEMAAASKLAVKDDIATKIGNLTTEIPEWLAQHGTLAGAVGILAIAAGAALAFHNPLSGRGNQDSNSEAQEERTMFPLHREMLEPPERQPYPGMEGQHMRVTIRGMAGRDTDKGHLAEMIQRVMSEHSGVPYQARMTEKDNRRPMNQGWISDLTKPVY